MNLPYRTKTAFAMSRQRHSGSNRPVPITPLEWIGDLEYWSPHAIFDAIEERHLDQRVRGEYKGYGIRDGLRKARRDTARSAQNRRLD